VLDKKDILQRFIAQLSEELASIAEAARKNCEAATSDEHQAKSKYDTFSLESSYLARGQAMRVQELREACERLQVLPLKAFDAGSRIQLGALVELEAEDGEARTVFLGPAAGGEEILIEEQLIVMVTPVSPLGKSVLGKFVGERCTLEMGVDSDVFMVKAIS
jgi:transcription elongation GreA/GreB family factor